MDLSTLRYAPTHEWARLDGDVVAMGITQFAAEQLGEITFIELPALGRAVKAGEEMGEIESVKSTSPLNAPVAGEVVARNEELLEDKRTGRKAKLEMIQNDPYGTGWMVAFKLAPGANLDHLLTKDKYDEQIASEGH